MSWVVVIGVGGYVKVIIDLLCCGGYEVVVCLDVGWVG